jgi:DNA-binding transcriptional LysR family regulator
MHSDLNQLLIFAKVVEQGSFIGAARALGLPKTTVSRKVQELEERLGTRLLQRTTRRVALTEAGATYHEYSSRIVQDLEEADNAVGRMREAPRGALRVSASFSFGMGALVPLVPEFLAQYPEINLQLELRNDTVDLLAEGFDLAVRIGSQTDSSYASRQLGRSRLYLYASPGYLEQHGAPAGPEDLPGHPTLTLSRFSRHGRYYWPLQNGHEEQEVYLTPHLVANDPGVIRYAAVAGLGIAILPAMLIRRELEEGSLQQVIPEWEGPPTEISAVYPSRRGLSPKVRAFIDFMGEKLEHLPGLQLTAPRPCLKD